MKSILFSLSRAVAIGVSALGIATTANWANHKSYWEGTIDRVQTTDFNILSHTLPTKLSYTLIAGDIEELQQTLNSNYGLFGLVVTNCLSTDPSCPNQQILYQTESKLSWRQQLKAKDLSNYPYDLLQNAPPLKATGGFESSRATTWSLTGKTNSGQIIGRVYYVRGIAPDFRTDYLNWIQGLPGSLLSDHGAQKYYALTTVLFVLGGLTSWSLIEWILYGKRLQKQLAQQNTERMLRELSVLRQQLRDRLQQVSHLIMEREKHVDEISQDERYKDERIHELEQAIAQLENQHSAPIQQNVSASTELEQNQELLQKEIQQREQTIASLQSQIALQMQGNSGSAKTLEALQSQLKEMTQRQSQDTQKLEQYELDLAQLRQEIARQSWEQQEKSNLIDILKKQLQDAQQQTAQAEERRVELESSVVALNHQQQQDSDRLIILEKEIEELGQSPVEPITNEFEALVFEHLTSSPKAQRGEWRIQYNLDVSDRSWGSQATDFLIIGQGIIFVVEAKYYPGTITAEGDAKATRWYCRSRSNAIPRVLQSAGKRNPYEQVRGYCDSTMSKLHSRRTNGRVKVYGIVVFPEGADASTISTQIKGYYRVTTLERLVQMVQDIERDCNHFTNEMSDLSPQQIEDLLCGRLILRRAA